MQMRRADDAGKIPDFPTSPSQTFRCVALTPVSSDYLGALPNSPWRYPRLVMADADGRIIFEKIRWRGSGLTVEIVTGVAAAVFAIEAAGFSRLDQGSGLAKTVGTQLLLGSGGAVGLACRGCLRRRALRRVVGCMNCRGRQQEHQGW